MPDQEDLLSKAVDCFREALDCFRESRSARSRLIDSGEGRVPDARNLTHLPSAAATGLGRRTGGCAAGRQLGRGTCAPAPPRCARLGLWSRGPPDGNPAKPVRAEPLSPQMESSEAAALTRCNRQTPAPQRCRQALDVPYLRLLSPNSLRVRSAFADTSAQRPQAADTGSLRLRLSSRLGHAAALRVLQRGAGSNGRASGILSGQSQQLLLSRRRRRRRHCQRQGVQAERHLRHRSALGGPGGLGSGDDTESTSQGW